MKTISYLLSVSMALILSAHTWAGPSFTIHTDSVRQTIDCFGASDAWSMQFMDEVSPALNDSVARWLFSQATDSSGNPEGIALSIWRFNIGAGSDSQGDSAGINRSTRTECLIQADGTPDWSKQAPQRRFLRQAKAYGVPYLLGFLNSPPVYLTKNSLATNTGRDGTFNLRDDCYDRFACFMADVAQGLERIDSVRLDYISPVNEPDGHWNWQGPKQEGTPATKQEIARLVRCLDAELTRRGCRTRIVIPESSDYRCMMSTHQTGPERGYEIQSFLSPDSTDTYVGDIARVGRLMAGHSYWTNTPVDAMRRYRTELADTLRRYGADFWQTEVCIMSNDTEIGGGGGFDRTMKTALYVARVIHHDLRFAQARSWQWWRAIGGDYKDGLLFRYRPEGAASDTIVDSGLLWTLGNYSRYIRPGAHRVDVSSPDATDTDPSGLMLTAYVNPDSTIAIVAINYSDDPAKCSLRIDGATPDAPAWNTYLTDDNGHRLSLTSTLTRLSDVTLPPRSVTTITSVQTRTTPGES